MKALVVEDNPSTTDGLETFLTNSGFDVDYASNGFGALTRLAISRPDIVVLDFFMPAMDGLETLRRIRGNANFADLPVLLITAAADPDFNTLVSESGAFKPVYYLRKPFVPRELVEEIQKIVGGDRNDSVERNR